MTEILKAVSVDFGNLAVSVLIVIGAVNAGAKLIGDFSKIIGKPVKWVRAREDVSKKVSLLEKQILDNKAASIEHDRKLDAKIEKIGEDLADLTSIVVDDRIDRMRYEILDMASAISEAKRWYSVEQFKHAMKTYSEYEEFLEKHDRKNGEIELSYEVICKAYKEKFKTMGNADEKRIEKKN